MGRQSRRFLTRIGAFTISAAIGSVMYCHLSLLRCWTTPLENLKKSQSHEDHWSSLKDSSPSNPFDLLVVGGGITGLYTAVDAAQRGLKVALVEAEDFGCAHSGEAPIVEAGAFPYVQRAFRQRDPIWLRRAWEVLEASAVWRNVAPDSCHASPFFRVQCSEGDRSLGMNKPHTTVWTLIPALHTAEMLELSVVAIGCTILSLLCGGATQYSTLLQSSTLSAELPGLGKNVHGGVWVQDLYLDRVRIVQQLLKTAEALGVSMLSYTPLCGIEYNTSSISEPSIDTTALIKATVSSSSGPLVADASIGCSTTMRAANHTFSVYTKGLINCAGAWADHVKALTPCNTSDAVPSAFDFFSIHSYLVASRDAVQAVSTLLPNPQHRALVKNDNGIICDRTHHGSCSLWYSTLCEKWNQRYRDATGIERILPAFQASSTLYTFSTSMVLPWYDQTVLLGPSISKLDQLPSKLSFSSTIPLKAVVRFTNNYQHQMLHISNALAAAGIEVDVSKVLACVSSIVPVLKDTSLVPWAADLFYRGYHVATYQRRSVQLLDTPVEPDEESKVKPECLRRPPFVHVYGGTPILARRIAEDAVDALLTDTCAIPEETKKKLKKCSTKSLQLLGFESMQALNLTHGIQKGSGSTSSFSILASKGREQTAEGIVPLIDGTLESFQWIKQLALGSYVSTCRILFYGALIWATRALQRQFEYCRTWQIYCLVTSVGINIRRRLRLILRKL